MACDETGLITASDTYTTHMEVSWSMDSLAMYQLKAYLICVLDGALPPLTSSIVIKTSRAGSSAPVSSG